MGDHIHTNAEHPIERETAETVRLLLGRGIHPWPFDRIETHVTFGFKNGKVSDHDVEGVKNSSTDPKNPKAYGKATIWLNRLLVFQNPDVVWEGVAPHEVSHVFAAVSAKLRNKMIEDHGPEWHKHRIHLSTYPHDIGDPAYFESLMDDRAYKLVRKKYLAAQCNCAGSAGFKVVAPQGKDKLFNGMDICSSCRSPRRPVSPSDAPADVQAMYAYLTNYFKNHGKEEA